MESARAPGNTVQKGRSRRPPRSRSRHRYWFVRPQKHDQQLYQQQLLQQQLYQQQFQQSPAQPGSVVGVELAPALEQELASALEPELAPEL